MSTSKILRGEFRNPYPDLKGPGANEVVDSLLKTVTEAKKRFGEPTEEDYELARLPLAEIQSRIIEWKELTLTRLVEARIRLTVKASLETHCLTAFPYEKALEQAKWYQETTIENGDYDDITDITGCYPFFGLVFSVKDCIHVEGHPTTLGCSSRAAKEETANAALVQKMLDAGAIMIAKTTAPQLMMSNTTHSPLWGTTRSPIQAADGSQEADKEFQVGGSSGGEASLVKFGGSQIGIGTDMGGSVRQPACLNELFGFKHVSQPDRIPWRLPQDLMTGLPHTKIPATALGFLAREDATLRQVVHELDQLLPVTYETDSESSEYKREVGNNPRLVYSSQHSSPEVQDLLEWLVKLVKAGYEDDFLPKSCQALGEIDLPSWGEAWTEHAKEHGFDEARDMLADEPLITRTLFDESRLSSNASDKDKETWKPDPQRLKNLKDRFLKQAGITTKDLDDKENIIFVVPTYILGGPVQNKAFVELDDAGESEIWCQIFNLLDWPCMSMPFPDLPKQLRKKFRDSASASSKWAQHLPGVVKADPIEGKTDDEGDRLPHLSLQLATIPGNQTHLLDYARRIVDAVKYRRHEDK